MKKLFAAAAAICMCTGAAIAEPLTDQDKAYVVASVASVIVLGKCPQYGAVTNSLQTFADKIGVNSNVIGPAILNAMQMGAGMEYDRTKLIPEVTRLLNMSADGLNDEVSQGKEKFCKHWGDFLAERGLIESKQ